MNDLILKGSTTNQRPPELRSHSDVTCPGGRRSIGRRGEQLLLGQCHRTDGGTALSCMAGMGKRKGGGGKVTRGGDTVGWVGITGSLPIQLRFAGHLQLI